MAIAWPMIKELMEIRARLDECLDEHRHLGAAPSPAETAAGSWCPEADLYEDGERLVLIMEVPGIDASGLSAVVQGDRLRVAGATSVGEAGPGGRYLRMERPEGSFAREFQLPAPVDGDGVQVSLKRGVLTVVMTKRPETGRGAEPTEDGP